MSVMVEHVRPGTLTRIAVCTSGVRLQMSTTVAGCCSGGADTAVAGTTRMSAVMAKSSSARTTAPREFQRVADFTEPGRGRTAG